MSRLGALAQFERTCAECGKLFLVQSGELYRFKIQSSKVHVYNWYCSWSHYKKNLSRRKKHGLSQDV